MEPDSVARGMRERKAGASPLKIMVRVVPQTQKISCPRITRMGANEGVQPPNSVIFCASGILNAF
jgi:hypothetical protein